MRKKIFFLVSFLLFFSAIYVSNASLIVPSDSARILPTREEVRDAVSILIAMPKSERRQRLKQAQKVIREYKAAKKAGEEVDTNTLLLVLLALILPPLAVYLHQGETNNKFWITTLLFALGLLGAFTIGWYFIFASVVYALIVILGNN